MGTRSRRSYVQRRRAQRTDETRARILDAVVALHEELGPSRTTIRAIAERAGVQRLTVYRHFPDEERLHQAWASRWFSDHPLPDPALWSTVSDPAAATRTALGHLFPYYRGTARMWSACDRDAEQVPALGPHLARRQHYLDAVAQGLERTWGGGTAGPEMRALIRHALRFSTWKSLADEGLDDEQMASLLVDWLATEADARAARRSGAV
jgi:AcrR family transcriptional regulator